MDSETATLFLHSLSILSDSQIKAVVRYASTDQTDRLSELCYNVVVVGRFTLVNKDKQVGERVDRFHLSTDTGSFIFGFFFRLYAVLTTT